MMSAEQMQQVQPVQRAQPEQLTMPGMPLPVKRAVWREHTAERWRRDDAEAVEECLHLIRSGEVNQTRLAAKFGVSTNTIHAVMMEFSVEELQGFTAKAAAIASMQSTAMITEVVRDARVKDLGALAMASKQTWDMAQVGSGGPTEIREERLVLRVEDFRMECDAHGSGADGRMDEEEGRLEMGAGMGLEGGNVLALAAGAGSAVGALRAASVPADRAGLVRGAGRVQEAVVIGDDQGAGGKQARGGALAMRELGETGADMVSKEGQNGGNAGPDSGPDRVREGGLEGTVGDLVTAEDATGDAVADGDLKGGGGGHDPAAAPVPLTHSVGRNFSALEG